MLFNSYIYIYLFLPLVFAIYFLLNHLRLIVAARIFLVGASLFFYGFWNFNYLILIVISLLFNFAIGNSLNCGEKAPKGKTVLIFGITINLLILGYFKYYNFFIDNLNSVFFYKV